MKHAFRAVDHATPSFGLGYDNFNPSILLASGRGAIARDGIGRAVASRRDSSHVDTTIYKGRAHHSGAAL